ncbi:MAG: DUF2723 domain-containing protein, partial [Anaerolineae bacterium]|nr:DUF2723 domain-containing protein [Anaerolineae bacterium]
GYPLYTMAGHLFIRLIPIGTPALRLNLMSAPMAVVTLLWLARATRLWARHLGASPLTARVGGLAAALALGSATTFWAQATIANIRMPTLFFAALALYALARFAMEGKLVNGRLVTGKLVNGMLASGQSMAENCSEGSEGNCSRPRSEAGGRSEEPKQMRFQRRPSALVRIPSGRDQALLLLALALGLGIGHHPSLPLQARPLWRWSYWASVSSSRSGRDWA